MRSMRGSRKPVKDGRAYDGSGRRSLALRKQDQIIEIAARRFLLSGYAPTTIAAIAEEAFVSVDTIYKTFGGKPGLIRAIYSRALRGSGPVPAGVRSDQLHGRERDPRQLIRAWGSLVTEISPLASPLMLLVRDGALADAELRVLREEVEAERLRRMTENAERLAAAGHLRPGVGVAEAADVLWTYSSPELYELLVLRRGMPLERFGRFVADAMIAALI